jgi:hypothetical protein
MQETHLWWHAERRRLESESIRDRMLFVGDDLDYADDGPRISSRQSRPKHSRDCRERKALETIASARTTPSSRLYVCPAQPAACR